MNFWNNPEYAPLKVLLVAIVAGIGGGFIYTSMHNDSTDTARLIRGGTGSTSLSSSTETSATPASTGAIPSLTTGGGTAGVTTGGGAIQGGDTKGGETTGVDGVGTTDGRESTCDTSTPIILAATNGMPTAPIPNTVYVGPSATSEAHPGHWLNFTLRNPSDCPVVVSKATIHLDTNDMTSWPPVQHVKLMNGGVQVGDTFNVPGTGTMPVGPMDFIFVHSTAHPFAVTIAPHSAQVFRVTSASQNVDANEYGGATPPTTTAAGTVVPGTGTPVYFSMQLTQFLSKNALSGAPSNQSVTAGNIPGTILTPHINIYN